MNLKEIKTVVADDEPDILEFLSFALEKHGFVVFKASDGKELLEKIYQHKPDIVISDIDMPNLTGYDVLQTLRNDSFLRHLPLIFLTGTRKKVEDRIKGMEYGCDDYIYKPVDPYELVARVKGLLKRHAGYLDANPLTKLPGNQSIEYELNARMNAEKPFAALYLDIDNFKSYNDKYGFLNGDEIIKNVGFICVNACRNCENSEDIVGHIGGDDFVIFTECQTAEKIANYILNEFNKSVEKYYSPEDAKNRNIEVKNRVGNLEKFPLMSISIAIISTDKIKITHKAEFSIISAELKKHAKSLGGNRYVFERRVEEHE
ncbi:MAG: response regulator [Elusimicrobiota bacterium]